MVSLGYMRLSQNNQNSILEVVGGKREPHSATFEIKNLSLKPLLLPKWGRRGKEAESTDKALHAGSTTVCVCDLDMIQLGHSELH